MAKNKITPKNIFEILAEGFWAYFKNIIPLTQAMLFPILGQFAGVMLIFVTTYFYTHKYIDLLIVNPFFNNAFVLFSILLILTIPGFFLFTKAFWHMMIVIVSLNPMIDDMHKKAKPFQSGIYEQNVRLRTKDYIVLLLIIAGIWLGAITIPFFFLGMSDVGAYLFIASEAILLFCASILSIYLCLSYQVFSFELNLSPIDTLKKSYKLVQGNFQRTVFLTIIFGVVTCIIIPEVVKYLSSEVMLTQLFARPVEAYFELMFANIDAVELLNKIPKEYCITTVYELALYTSASVISMVTTALFMPLGSAWYTLLYKDITNRAELAAIAKEKQAAKKSKPKTKAKK